jgi:uncharacterized membrane protein
MDRMYCLILIVLSVFSIVAVPGLAQEQYSLVGNVKDISTNKAITNLPVIVTARNLNYGIEERSTEYLDQKGSFSYQLQEGNWRFTLFVYDPNTNGVDYYADRAVFIQPSEPVLNKIFYLTPVGSIEGTVVDNAGRLIDTAALDFKCSSNENVKFPTSTDKFGSFKADIVPVGKCKVSAEYQKQVGAEEITVEKGSALALQITLSDAVLGTGLNPIRLSVISLIVLLVVVLIIALVFFIRKKLKKLEKEASEQKSVVQKLRDKTHHLTEKVHRKEAKKEHSKEAKTGEKEKKDKKEKEEQRVEEKKEEKEELNPRARDIMKTLNEREQQVVQFLLQHENASTQATLRNNTGIPKTTLVRVFQSLESKKIIFIEKIGKMKKIVITPWFLGKE